MSTAIPNTTELTSPSYAQRHQALLQDYDVMLTALRETEPTADKLLRPHHFSPMELDSQTAQTALKALVAQKDYRSLCLQLKASNSELTVHLKEGRTVYEAPSLEGAKQIPLVLTGKQQWREYIEVLDNAVHILRGSIRSDGLYSLEQMTRYYAIAPWDPKQSDQVQSAIDAVEEKRACHSLELENGLAVDELRLPATPKDRKAYKALRQHAPQLAATLTFKHYMAKRTAARIVDTISPVLPPETTLLTYLSSEVDLSAALETIRAKPTVYLEKLLNSAKAQSLGDLLIKALGWYGAAPGEQTAPTVLKKLICHAIGLYCHAPSADTPDEIAGYNVQKPGNWGKSYQHIRAEFEAHLLKSKRAASEKEASILARIYQPALPKSFAIRDVPPELPYRGTVVWVNFAHGVLLAEALGAGVMQRLNFQQLVNLPLTLSEAASDEELKLIALARVIPTLEWAITQGYIAHRWDMEYSVAEIEQAVKALDDFSDRLDSAITRIDADPPRRLAMAKAEKDRLFGSTAFDDGRKLVLQEKKPSHVGPGLLKTPSFVTAYSFVDVYADGRFDNGETWLQTHKDGTTVTDRWIKIDAQRKISTYRNALFADESDPSIPWFDPNGEVLPDVAAQFKALIDPYIASVKDAYKTLIISVLASLPPDDRQILATGELRLLSLRQETKDTPAVLETPEMVMPLRARMGFILQVRLNNDTFYYEVFPRTALIRRREDITASMLGPEQKMAFFNAWPGTPFIPLNEVVFSTYPGAVNRTKKLTFDWDAHIKGTEPAKDAQCSAILDPIGEALSAKPPVPEEFPSLSSPRFLEIAQFISDNFLYVDETALRAYAKGQTQFDKNRERSEAKLQALKGFVPFWGSVEDLMSGDWKKILEGVIGLAVDLASFLLPIGKFISGSVRIAMIAGKVGITATLRSFGTASRTLMFATLKNLNPLDGVSTLLKSIIKNGIRGAVRIGSRATRKVRTLTGHAGSYSFTKGLPQVSDPGRWRALNTGDQLASLNNVVDVPIRNVPSADTPLRHFLVDPLSSKPYGPPLLRGAGNLSPGRSVYDALEKTDTDVVVQLSDNSEVLELLEIDGRTTLFIDDVPYRLDGDTLRRADTLDTVDTLKTMPCRVRRAPGADVCQTSYVTHTPGPTPRPGVFDEAKSWAPWFGNTIYTPASNRLPLSRASLTAHSTLEATMEFQTGIYGRVKLSVPTPEQDLLHTFQAGTVIVEAIDDSKQYLFTRLNAGDFYVAEVAKGQSLRDALVFRKASTLPEAVRAELQVIYTGSLHANNMVRIHGVEAVERAVKTMEEIAIPIGGHANPPETLKWLKVDTSPGEAAMFDHSTRMIISKLPEGATSWSRSKHAPEALRHRTAEIFDTLFLEPVIALKKDSALKINATMQRLQKLIPFKKRPRNARNIAYAEVITAAGKREVYVSVSGAQGATGHLPLFKHNRELDEVVVGNTTYFNIDRNASFPSTSLNVTDEGKLLAIPRTIDNIDTYRPELTSRPTSLDSESKLIRVIREKYPERESMKSVNVATTMPPCDSCSVVMKEFAYDGGENALQVLWK